MWVVRMRSVLRFMLSASGLFETTTGDIDDAIRATGLWDAD